MKDKTKKTVKVSSKTEGKPPIHSAKPHDIKTEKPKPPTEEKKQEEQAAPPPPFLPATPEEQKPITQAELDKSAQPKAPEGPVVSNKKEEK